MWDIGNKMAEGAALMTGTTWTSRVLGTAYPQHMNKVVAESICRTSRRWVSPNGANADEALAKALQKELGERNRRRSGDET